MINVCEMKYSETEFTPEHLLEAALSDKKRAGKLTTIVVPEAVGHCVLKEVDDDRMLEVFKAGWR